jgi:hypothetical protein
MTLREQNTGFNLIQGNAMGSCVFAERSSMSTVQRYMMEK